MPIISDQMKKAAKKAAAQEKKMKEEEEHRQREEQMKREQEEREQKEREEQEKQEKKKEKRQKRKEKADKEKREKQELEKRANMRKELALIKRSTGAKELKDEEMLGRHGLSITRKELTSGSFSKLYKAKQGENDNVVCKVILLDKTPLPYRQNLLETSLKVQRYVGGGGGEAEGTKHPNLVKVVDIYCTDKKAYIFMTECQTKTLHEKIKSSESLDENEVKKTVKDVAQCLQYLHSIGVAHNNLRPSNVIHDKENALKVVGLDMCSVYWDPDLEQILPKKKLSKRDFDKSNHLPPEAFTADTYDPSLADVWGVGVLMCQLVAKENPFKIKVQKPFEEQWKAFAETKTFSDEAKQLLDRIFCSDAQSRPNITEVLEDSYLKNAA